MDGVGHHIDRGAPILCYLTPLGQYDATPDDFFSIFQLSIINYQLFFVSLRRQNVQNSI